MKFPLANRNSFFDQLFVFILIIYTGSATVFVRSIATWENPIGLLLPIVLSFVLAFIHKVNISRNFLFLVLGFTLYNLMLTIKFQAIHPKFFGIYIISVLLLPTLPIHPCDFNYFSFTKGSYIIYALLL